MKIILVAGGTIEDEFGLELFKTCHYDKIIGIDKGVAFLYKHNLKPDLIVGDFDSLPEEILHHYQGNTPIRKFIPEKDATDMEIGIRSAIEMGADEIVILGGTGTRIDHVIANIQTLMIPLEKGVNAYLQDKHNRIRLLKQGINIQKEQMFGGYVSFFALTTTVEGLTLKGFKYPLNSHTLTSDNSLGVSNEVVDEKAFIQFQTGILIMIESHD